MRRPGWLVNAQHHVQWSWQRHSQPPLDVTTNESLMRINLEWPNDPILMVFVLKNIVLYKFSSPSFKNLSHSNYRVVWTLCETKSGEAFGPENAPFEPCLWRVRIKNSGVIHGEQEGARYPWGDSQFGNPYGYPIFTKVFDTVDLVPGGYQLYGIRTSSFTSQSFEDCFPCQTHILAKCFVPRPWILWSPHQRQPRCPKNGWGTFGDAVDAGKLSGSLSGSGIWSVFGKQIFFQLFVPLFWEIWPLPKDFEQWSSFWRCCTRPNHGPHGQSRTFQWALDYPTSHLKASCGVGLVVDSWLNFIFSEQFQNPWFSERKTEFCMDSSSVTSCLWSCANWFPVWHPIRSQDFCIIYPLVN